MSQTKAKPARPFVVLGLLCDHCGNKLDVVVVAKVGTEKRIANAYHDSCWTANIMPTVQLQREN